ncbi:MAG: helix-turn-helix transcriptional regulator [Burkholderiales bacterium]
MADRDYFGQALRRARKARGMTQEDFATMSSRTYVSMLERGERSPTLAKINELSAALKIHPLTLLALAYAGPIGPAEMRKLLTEIEREAITLMHSAPPTKRPNGGKKK